MARKARTTREQKYLKACNVEVLEYRVRGFGLQVSGLKVMVMEQECLGASSRIWCLGLGIHNLMVCRKRVARERKHF